MKNLPHDPSFVPVTFLEDLWDGEIKNYNIGEKSFVLIHLADEIYAYENRCPHLGRPLDKGLLINQTLTCPFHHWVFNACTGAGINPRLCRLKSHPVKISDNIIYIKTTINDLPPKESSMTVLVGPVFSRTLESQILWEVIKENYPLAQIEDNGSYIRILLPGPCRISRQQIEEKLGRTFHLPEDLEKIMPSFKGSIYLGEDEIEWRQ